MGVNKVVYGNTVLVDLTEDTVAPDKLLEGYTAHDRTGTLITGTATSGGGEVVEAEQKDVNFMDYDGTILYSYTTAEALALTALPPNPTHAGLTSQGWNWSLADMKTQVAAQGVCDIGQMYITDDGKTRIYIRLDEGRKSPMLGLAIDGTVDVDWGDGTAHDTLTGTSTSTTQWTNNHQYNHGGDYVIKLTVTGTALIEGNPSVNGSANYGCPLCVGDTSKITYNKVYTGSIRKIELGTNIDIGTSHIFYLCIGLEAITIPNHLTKIGNYCFSYCSSLRFVVIPDGIEAIGQYIFYYNPSIKTVSLPYTLTSISSYCFYANGINASNKRIVIPNNVEIIETYAFSYLYIIGKIIVPANVTTIQTNVFRSSTGLKEIHFQALTPPNLAGSSCFDGLSSDYVIYVPYSADHSVLNAYKTASVWTNVADRIMEESST